MPVPVLLLSWPNTTHQPVADGYEYTHPHAGRAGGGRGGQRGAVHAPARISLIKVKLRLQAVCVQGAPVDAPAAFYCVVFFNQKVLASGAGGAGSACQCADSSTKMAYTHGVWGGCKECLSMHRRLSHS